jgi:para-nitrobenzyl esterase
MRVFAWPSNRPGLGACHALELGFVFDTGEVPESRKLAGEGAPQELADAMHGAWVRFAAEGDPGWQRWDASHPVRIFGDGGLDTVDRMQYTAYGPRDRELALWAADTATGQPPPALPAAAAVRRPQPAAVVRRLRLPGGVRRR